MILKLGLFLKLWELGAQCLVSKREKEGIEEKEQ